MAGTYWEGYEKGCDETVEDVLNLLDDYKHCFRDQEEYEAIIDEIKRLR